MSTLKITAARQLALTPDLLKHLGVRYGDEVIVDTLPRGRIELRARPKGKISGAFGMLKAKTDRVLSIEEISRDTARGWAGKP